MSTGIEALRTVAVLTAGTFNREFYQYMPSQRRRVETTPEDIAWNVLNWAAHTGLDSVQVWRSANGDVIDVELWDADPDERHAAGPEVTYTIVVPVVGK